MLTKTTTNAYNLKRAKRFADAGINSADVTYAHPEFMGCGESICTLCDHPHIVYLFRLRFDAPSLVDALGGVAKGITRTTEVVFDNVGSTCITQWFDALPESAEKLAALARWHKEVTKMKAAMAKKVVESLCLKAGYETPEDAYEAFKTLQLGFGKPARTALNYKARKQLTRNARNIRFSRSSRGTVKSWLASLELALAAQNAAAPVAAPEPAVDPELAKLSDEDRDLIERGRTSWKAGKANLNDWERTAFKDIGQKVVKFGSFAPGGKQRALYADMLTKLEASAEVAEAPVAQPANVPFVSPSGIDGASY